MNRKFMLAATTATAFTVGVGVLAAPSSANAAVTTDTSTFTQSNIYPSAQVQNWGNLGLSCQGNTCSVTLNPQGDTFFGNEFLGFNLASGASGVTLSSTLLTAGATLSSGSFNLDGFGTFSNLISLPDGPSTGYSSTVSLFTAHYNGDAGTLLTLNGGGFDAAGHVLFAGSSCTGFVGEGTGTNGGSSTSCGTTGTGVPEPGAMLLFGIGLVAVGGFSLKQKRNEDALTA
jgi:hypothetical protein